METIDDLILLLAHEVTFAKCNRPCEYEPKFRARINVLVQVIDFASLNRQVVLLR